MDKDSVETMLSLVYDAPCKYINTKENSMYFIIESRSSRSLNTADNEIMCDNFIETDSSGQVINCYDFALKTDENIIVELTKDSHGEQIRDKIIVYDNDINIVHQFVNTDNIKYSLKLLNDEIRCIKDSNNVYYGLDGSIIQDRGEA